MSAVLGIFDSHAHYDDDAFDIDREELLANFPQQGIVGILNVGCDLKSSQRSIEYSSQYPYFWSAVGIHPENAAGLTAGVFAQLEQLLSAPKVVAIGEVGLDYHYDTPERKMQQNVFAAQLELAQKHSLPVVIHSRDATADTLALVREYHPTGVFHCFSGSVETAKEVLDLGMYIGFTGVVSFKNAKKAHEVAKMVPLERLLLETDCPYMAPVPHRGKRSQSDMIADTAVALAELRNTSAQVLIDAARENTCRLFGIR